VEPAADLRTLMRRFPHGVAVLTVDADGTAGQRPDGRFGFTRLVLRLDVETEPADADNARRLADQAEQTCLVSASLDLPVETVIEVRHRSAL